VEEKDEEDDGWRRMLIQRWRRVRRLRQRRLMLMQLW